MWMLALRSLRYRKTAFIASLLALLAGTALVTACGTLMETGLAGAVPPQALAGAPIVVAGDQSNASETVSEWARLDEGLVRTVASVRGVARAVGHVAFPAVVLRNGRPVDAGSLGHDWRSAGLAAYSPTAEPAAGQVVLDANLAARAGIAQGDRIVLAARGVTGTFTVTGLARSAEPAVHPPIFFSAPDTERLAAHPGQVSAIAVFPAAGTSTGELDRRLTAELAGEHAAVLTGDRRGLAEFPEAGAGAGRLRILAGAFASWTVLATLFGVASMIALSVQQRQREMALLRAIGTTPRQVRRMIVIETFVLSALATALAAFPGGYVGRRLFAWFTDHGAASPLLEFRSSWAAAVAGASATMIVALGAAVIAGRGAARTKPVQALLEVSVEPPWLTRPRLAFAILFLAAGLSLAIVTLTVMRGPFTVSVAGPASIMFAIGLALLAPGLTKAMVALLGGPLRAGTGLAGELAVTHARTLTRRLAAAVTPVILLTAIATGVLYLQATEDAANERLYADTLNADVVVASAAGGFGPGVAGRVRAVPGVAAATEFVTATARMRVPADDSQVGGWKLQGLNGEAAARTAGATPVAGDLADLSGMTAAIPAETARAHGLRLGDPVTLELGDTSVLTVRVVALLAAHGERARILLPSAVLAPHTGVGLPTVILARTGPGTDAGQVLQRIARLGADVPGLRAAGKSALVAGQTSIQRMLRVGNYAIVVLVIGYAVLSVVNTTVAATGRRRREFALQRLAGATRAQVVRMMSIEGLIAAATGIVLGSAAATLTLIPFSLVKNGGLLPAGSPWMYAAVVGVVLATTLAATVVTTWRATRGRPIHAAFTLD